MKRFFSCLIVIVLVIVGLLDNNNDIIENIYACGYYDFNIVEKKDCKIISINNVDSLDNIIDNLSIEIHYVREICGSLVIEGYSNSIEEYVLVDGLKSNIQISYIDSKVIIGIPLILDSF